MALSFAFDANQETPATVARRRAIADMLAGRIGRAQNVGEGLGDLISGVAGGFQNYRANKGEASNTQRGNDLFNGGLNFPSFTQAPQMPAGGDIAAPAPSQPPAPKLDFGGFNGIPASKSVSAADLLRKPAPAAGGGALPQSFLASVDRTEGAGGYDTLFGHANKKGPFAGTSISNMTVADAIRFADPSGAYAGHVKGQIGRVATPMGRYQIVGKTLRAAAKDLNLDPNAKFDARTQDMVAAHLARQRIASANTLQGKIAALRSEWHGFKSVPDSQMAQIVADLQSGRSVAPAQAPVQVASNDAAQAFQAAQPIPQPIQQQPAPGNIQPAATSGFDPRWATEVISSPYTSPEQKAAAKMMLEQFMQQQDPLRQMQMQAAQQGLTKGQLEIQQMQKPKPIEVGGRLLDPQTFKPVYEPPAKQLTPLEQAQLERTQVETENLRNPKPKLADPMSESDAARIALDREKFEFEKAQKSGKWSKLSDGSLFNEQTGEVKQVPSDAPTVDFKDVSTLRKEVQDTPQIKNYMQAAPIYRSMVETAGRNSRASDLNIVYGLGKIMDPTSVVREGEMVMVKSTASLPDWLQGAIASLNGGAALTPETRQAIMTEAQSRMSAYAGEAEALRTQYEGIANRYKINMQDFWQDLPKLPDFSGGALDKDGWKAMPNGVKIRVKK